MITNTRLHHLPFKLHGLHLHLVAQFVGPLDFFAECMQLTSKRIVLLLLSLPECVLSLSVCNSLHAEATATQSSRNGDLQGNRIISRSLSRMSGFMLFFSSIARAPSNAPLILEPRKRKFVSIKFKGLKPALVIPSVRSNIIPLTLTLLLPPAPTQSLHTDPSSQVSPEILHKPSAFCRFLPLQASAKSGTPFNQKSPKDPQTYQSNDQTH